MQTLLNPLLSNIISGDKLASSLTFGSLSKQLLLSLLLILRCGESRNADIRIRLVCAVPCIHGNSCSKLFFGWSNSYLKKKKLDKASGFVRLSETLASSVYFALLPGYHVPCRYRCSKNQYYCS